MKFHEFSSPNRYKSKSFQISKNFLALCDELLAGGCKCVPFHLCEVAMDKSFPSPLEGRGASYYERSFLSHVTPFQK